MNSTTKGEGTISPVTRGYLVMVIVAIASFGIPLYLFPSGAPGYWAWTIAEPRTAMLVGSIYMVCTLYYPVLFMQREWLLIHMSLRSLFVVAAWLLVVGMFHWETFYPWRALTLTWIASYYLPLFFLPILFRLQRDRYGIAVDAHGPRIAAGWQRWLRMRAFAYSVVVVVLLAFTPTVREAWPWPIELVNLRMLSGQVALFGVFPALVMVEGSWRRMQFFMLITAMMGVAHLLLLNLPIGPYDWSSRLGWPLMFMPVEWLATSLGMIATHGLRGRSHA